MKRRNRKLRQDLRVEQYRTMTLLARIQELEAENQALRSQLRREGARRSALHDLSRHTF